MTGEQLAGDGVGPIGLPNDAAVASDAEAGRQASSNDGRGMTGEQLAGHRVGLVRLPNDAATASGADAGRQAARRAATMAAA